VEALKESRISADSTDMVWISTAEIIDKIMAKWKKKHPNICIIVLGDMQETWTTSDRDNLGKFRVEKPQNGILALLEDTHSSIVREKSSSPNYITRMGTAGGRGIDHILYPRDTTFATWVSNTSLDRSKGGLFFPSDHSYIHCSIHRSSPNNSESGTMKDKFDYKKIFNIKLQRTGPKGDQLKLDESQFKACQHFQDQKALFEKIQTKTGNNADNTDYFIGDLEKRASGLIKNLWYAGLCQNVDGTENKLVCISDHQAIEVAHIVKKFNLAIKEVMADLELHSEGNTNDNAGGKRGRLRKGKGFRQFDNLPIPTKIRYLRTIMTRKSRLIRRASQWLKEFQLKKGLNTQTPQWSELIQILILVENTTTLDKCSKLLCDMAMVEAEERQAHLQAIIHEKSRKNVTSKNIDEENDRQWENQGNKLPHVSEEIESELNKILENSNSVNNILAESIRSSALKVSWTAPLVGRILLPPSILRPRLWIILISFKIHYAVLKKLYCKSTPKLRK